MRFPKILSRSVSVVVFFSLSFYSIANQAQTPTGTVIGTITDPHGAVLPNANVTIRDASNGAMRTTVSSLNGTYEFPTLRPSTYELTAEAAGFSKAVERNVSVVVGDVARIDIRMQVGAASEVVEVKGEALLVEADKNSISYAVDPTQIQSLPMLGRNVISLALITPGSVPQASGTQAGGFSVSGMRAQSNNFTLDGINNNDPQVNGPLSTFNMTDAIQEFNVQTSIAGAEIGRNPGAQVSLITKSGSNDYHGSLFYYGRNEALDANDYFLNHAGQKKNVLRRHQYGGSMGGYIVPDKTFWFGSIEAVQQVNPLPQAAQVPTLAERATVTDPISQKLLNFFPLPDTTAQKNGNNWAGVAPQMNNNETYFLRVDHNVSTNHHVFARGAVFLGRTNTLQQNPFDGNITNWPSSHSYVADDTYSTSRLVNETRLGFSRNHTFFQASDRLVNPASIFTDGSGNPLPGFVNTKVDALDGGLPRITISGPNNLGLGAGTNMPQGRATNTYELTDDVTLSLGSHMVRFGGEARRELTNRFLNGNFRGAISFPSFARFAAGLPRTGSLRTGGPDQSFRNWYKNLFYFYLQDTYKVISNVTMTYGLRYELPGAMKEIHNRGSNFVPGVGMVNLGSNMLITIDPSQFGRNAIVLTPTSVTLPSSGQFQTAKTNFAPYLGITYAPNIFPKVFGSGKTVIRTGFRLSYDEIFNNIPVNMGLNAPQVLSTTLPSNDAPGYTWGTVLSQNRKLFTADATVPDGQRGIVTFNAWDSNAPSAYGMNYTLEIERQIGSTASAGISYVGSQGRKLGIFTDSNEPLVSVVDPARRGDQTPNLRSFPFQQYAAISSGTLRGSSHYNAMIVTYKQRPMAGLTLQGSYTYGRSMDFNSSFFGSDRDFGAPADPRNLAAEYGRSDFDIRHRVVLSYLYDLPFGNGHSFWGNAPGVLKGILGDWQASGIFSYHSGFPFTVFGDLAATDYSGFNQFADRGSFKPGITTLKTDVSNPDLVFDKNVFMTPGAGDIGNTRRNGFDGPGATNWDFGILKSIPLREKMRFQLRAELFNVLNHPQFNLPVSNMSSSSFGKITSDSNANPRLIQLGLRFEY